MKGCVVKEKMYLCPQIYSLKKKYYVTRRNQQTEIYDCTHSRIYQQNGYIKVAYTFDYGKKISREWKNVNTNINSAILKAE